MKNADTITQSVVAEVEESTPQVHPLQKQHMFVSTKAVDYDNLTAFEAVAMSAVFVLAIVAGAVTSLTIA